MKIDIPRLIAGIAMSLFLITIFGISFSLIIMEANSSRRQEQWCIKHGYTIRGTRDGPLCVDSNRRVFVPEGR